MNLKSVYIKPLAALALAVFMLLTATAGRAGDIVAVPPAPNILSVTQIGAQEALINWLNGADNYDQVVVQRQVVNGDALWHPVAAVTGSEFTVVDDGLFCFAQYSYRVYAVRDGIMSAYSAVEPLTMICQPPTEEQHLLGGQFEVGTLAPEWWSNNDPARNKVRCDKMRPNFRFVERSYTGRCSLMMKGSSERNSKVQQFALLGGLHPGDEIEFGGYVRAKNLQPGMRIRVVAVYPEGAGTSSPRSKAVINIPTGSYDWSRVDHSLTLEAVPQTLRFQLINKASGGRAEYDDLFLTSDF
jgi:hypothetical protein